MNKILASLVVLGAVSAAYVAGATTRADTMAPLTDDMTTTLTIERNGACGADADGGVVGVVTSDVFVDGGPMRTPDGGVIRGAHPSYHKRTCWFLHATLKVPTLAQPDVYQTVVIATPLDADDMTLVDTVIADHVLPVAASTYGFAIADGGTP